MGKHSIAKVKQRLNVDTRVGIHIFDSFVPIFLHEVGLHRNKVKAQGQFSQTVLHVYKFHHIATVNTALLLPEHLQSNHLFQII